MKIEQLEYVIEVAKSGSLTEASKKLHISQSALSQSITNLEVELSVKILQRSRMGATPTEAGKQIIKKAMEALEKLREIKEEADAYADNITGELRIGTVPGTAMYLPKILSSYKADYPNIQIQVTEKSSQAIVDDIKQDKLDIGLIGLTREGTEKRDKEIELEVVLRGKMVAVVNKHSPLAFAESITSEEIRKQSLVIYNDDRMWEFINDFSAQFGPLHILFTTNNMDAIRNSVMENLAITIGPDYTVKNDPYVMNGEGVPLIIADYEHDYPGMAVVWSSPKRDSPIVKVPVQKTIQMMQSQCLE
ncbi:LysR family transcriptional regulator [Sporosarcina koreensis]|uniref:LysR family transcriptional regulator n=1 Tax=Bacillales TaxID=1385 RepID=UPI000755A37E|nr:LysR family transcriptional regulator [Sporosarcina koreensis]